MDRLDALEKRVEDLETFAAMMAEFVRAVDDDLEGPNDDGEVADQRQRWRMAHDAARARRRRERG
ncbi:MAG: hypothetical protein V3V98_00970 [Thermoplasmata archaeon]